MGTRSISPAGISYEKIYLVVSRIPCGCVATYGQIARLAGIPRHARVVGYALSALNEHSPVPWHRVVNAAGQVSARSNDSPMGIVQRLRLEKEGIRFDGRGRLQLSLVQWLPDPEIPLT